MLHGLLLALAAAVLLHVGIIVVVNLLGHALHLDAVEKASMIYSNAGNLIIPIVTAVLGKEWCLTRAPANWRGPGSCPQEIRPPQDRAR